MQWDDATGQFYQNDADPALLADADNDTKIQVEETADEDKIRMDVEGEEKIVIRNNNVTGNHVMIEVMDNDDNVFLGRSAGQSDTIGIRNTFIGTAAGLSHAAGGSNTFIGRAAGAGHTFGTANTFIGDSAGGGNSTGWRNTMIGTGAGTSSSGFDNIFLGYNAGFNESGSDKLYIENSDADADNALIYGEFDNDLLRFNAGLFLRDDLQMPTGAAQDYFLKTDSLGNASWQPLLGNSFMLPDLGGSIGIGVNPLGLSVQGNYAYIVDNFAEDLKVIDVSDPTNPSLSGSVNVGPSPNSDPRAVVAQGNYAYVLEDNDNRLRIFDVSDPTNPSFTGNLGIGGEPTSISVIGNYAYIVDKGSNDLKVVDVSTPASPTLSGSLGIGTNPRSIFVKDTLAYVVDNETDDLKTISVFDPANPALTGSLVLGTAPTRVFVQGNYAYITDGETEDLKVVDVSDPANPSLSGSVGIGTGPNGVSVQGNYAYITDNASDDLKIVDVSDPANPNLIDSLSIGTGPRHLIVQGNYAYITDSESNELSIKKLSQQSVGLNQAGELISIEDNWKKIGNDVSNTNSGNVGIGTTSPNFNLEVIGTLAASDLPFGDFKNVQWDDVTGQFYHDNSSKLHKEHITTLQDDFQKILQARAVTYTRPDRPDRWEIGFIAEEFDEIGLTKLVDYGPDGTVEDINYEKISLYLNEVNKDQQARIEKLEKEMEQLKALMGK